MLMQPYRLAKPPCISWCLMPFEKGFNPSNQITGNKLLGITGYTLAG